MKLNIKGIINLKFTDFKDVKELLDYVSDNFEFLENIIYSDQTNVPFGEKIVLDYEEVFDKMDEIWIVNNYLVAYREKGDINISMNNDFGRFLAEESFNYKKEVDKKSKKTQKIKSSKVYKEPLCVDSILDRISEVGFENITEAERKFLDENG